jgi:hypothetical protein
MAYIKSYSNYVIQKKHQLLNNGTVFERDFSTVGGIGDNFISNQKYRQGTFVYSINNEIASEKKYNKNDWEKNGENLYWNQDNIGDLSDSNDTMKISLKQDIYKLKDFAYYGSCTELIRSSINDIINRFPGELYCTNINGPSNLVTTTNKYVADNPFNIDIYTPPELISEEEKNNIKFFTVNYDKYEFINSSGDSKEITRVRITSAKTENCYNNYTVTIQHKNGAISIKCAHDDYGNLILLSSFSNVRIRPKKQYYDEFINSLDSFQKILLNQDSEPKYSAIFELLEETEDGYNTFYKKFTFPTSYGGYNLDVVSSNYGFYLSSLAKYGEIFDNLYCNNLYRQMTHESIKNFDWTDTLNRNEETKEDYIENADKIQKMLLLFGREFDEIKFYIDGIKNSNNISYNDANNLSDYFLTDVLNLDGWDIKNVFPLLKNTSSNTFNEDVNSEYKPYTNLPKSSCGNLISFPNGYFSGYWNDDCTQSRYSGYTSDGKFFTDNKGCLRNRIKAYTNEKSFSMKDMNNKFMKNLKLNSRYILQKKGTIEGIENLLSLFGLRSKRWYESLEQNTQFRLLSEMNLNKNTKPYDYEIIEYVTISEPIIDGQNSDANLPITNNLIEFFNSTKTLTYTTIEENPYKGLPIRYYETNDKRVLFPYFSKDMEIDGKPYYQMNGGWLHKEYYFDGTELFSSSTNNYVDGGFNDTNTQISSVNSLGELLKLDDNLLYDNIIYYVKNIKGDFVCVNDELYEIEYNIGSKYFKVVVNNGKIKIGKQEWYGTIRTYNENYDEIIVDLSKFENNSYFKIFISNNHTIFISQNENVLINYSIIQDGKVLPYDENDNGTNYYILRDKNWKSTIGFWGWEQLKTSDNEYKTILNIKKDYNANNPHVNCLKYDNGIEYLRHFYQLFRYAIKNETFNKNCYSNLKEYMHSLNKMEDEIGFKNIITNNQCSESINLYKDTKIHHFCDVLTSGDTKYFCELDESSTNGYTLFDDLTDYKELKTNSKLNVSGCTCLDQIINLKNIDIIFYINKKQDECEQSKYFDNIILHYLSQIIPSNVILNLKIKKHGISVQ